MNPGPALPASPRHSPPAYDATSRVRLWAGLIVLFGLVGVALKTWIQEEESGDALARARRTGMIRIGYAVEAPYAFLTGDGQVSGESPEIARIIVARLGIPRVEWRLEGFGNLLDELEAGRFDVIAAGMFITPERQRRVAFSRPTFRVGPGLLVRNGNPHRLHSYSDILRQTGLRVAVLDGSDEEARLRQLGCPEERLLRVPDAFSGGAAVRSGQAVALALSAPTLRWMTKSQEPGSTEMARPFVDSTNGISRSPAMGAFVFRKDETALVQAWNAELERFIGSQEHQRIVSAFGFSEAELPPANTPRPEASPP